MAARLKHIEGGGIAFLHECSICADPNAAWGYGVHLMTGKPGIWYCAKCRAEAEAPVKRAELV